MIDATVYKNVLGSFPSGVTVITTLDDDGQVVGLTASAFSSLSMEPPLVLFCPNYSSDSYPVLIRNKRFAIHLLSGAQQAEAYAFARKGIGFGLLGTGQQVDGEALVADQHRVGVGAVVGAEQHQRRLHGQRAEGAGGQADDLAVVVQGGYHRDAGREGAQDVLVDGCVDHGVVLGSSGGPRFCLMCLMVYRNT